MLRYKDQVIFGNCTYIKMSKEDEYALIDKAQNGCDRAMSRLVVNKVRLIKKWAIDEFGKAGRGVPLEDLIADGCIVVMKAIKNFDHKRNIRLSSYCKTYVRRGFQDSFRTQSRVVNYPAQIINNHGGVYSALLRLERKLKREVTEEEVSVESGFSACIVKGMSSFANKSASFDDPITDEYADPDSALNYDLTDLVEKTIFRVLSDRDVLILKMYIYDGASHRKIAEKLKEHGYTKTVVTAQYVSLLYQQIKQKLRELHDSKTIMNLLEVK
jgi:RNA polymerase sigma factor (sigma-70 family)